MRFGGLPGKNLGKNSIPSVVLCITNCITFVIHKNTHIFMKVNNNQINEQIENLIQSVVSSGLKFQIEGPHEDRILGELTPGYLGVRFNPKSSVWHWFVFNYSERAPYLTFHHSYSQTNGRTRGAKAYRHRRIITEQFERIFGLRPEIF